jgi:rhodanese-related sulfurtransferase
MPAPAEVSAPDSLPEISRDEIVRRLRDPSLAIVDVLPPESYAEAHLPGAVNLPLADVPRRAREVLPDPFREIAVYCGGGT